ncbi:MAG TPA: hypothetical protein ENK85_02525 [Saprospiraceae bacterium]|nr:hypothetical protein [Saprospiraceae bacterium]
MKIFIFTLVLLVHHSFLFAQAEDFLIFNIDEEIELSGQTFIGDLVIRRKRLIENPKPYSRYIAQAVDSVKRNGGNCLKVTGYCQSSKIQYPGGRCSAYLMAKMYRIDTMSWDSLSLLGSRYKQSYRQRNLDLIDFMLPKSVFSLRRRQNKGVPEVPFFKGIPIDFVSDGRFEIGVTAGLDYLLLFNGGIVADVFVVNGRSFKLSLNNKAGFMIGFGALLYEYPSVKIHARYSNIWFTSSFGREFTRVAIDENNYYNRTIDYRMDLGVKMYKRKNESIELSVPLRVDEEIPIFLTGVQLIMMRRF